jgi:hypothetical protein
MSNDILSYSARLVTEILTKLKIPYIIAGSGRGGVRMIVKVTFPNGMILSIQTNPLVARDAFCETMGVTPANWESEDNIARLDTPEELRSFLRILALEHVA